MKSKMILVSGIPATGKTTFAKWLSGKLRVPHVCYDNILAKTLETAKRCCDEEEQIRNYFGEFPYEFLWFCIEEVMKSSSIVIVDYHFTDMMKQKLDEVTEKYQYDTITVHMDCPAKLAYERWVERNKLDSMRPNISLEQFINGTKQNKDFRYGSHFVYVDASDYSLLSYEDIFNQVRELVEVEGKLRCYMK